MKFCFMKFMCLITLPGSRLEPYELIRDNSLNVYHVLYGDLTKIDQLFIDPADYEGPDDDETIKHLNSKVRKKIDLTLTAYPDSKLYKHGIYKNTSGLDVNDFNDITESMSNATRREYEIWFSGYVDPEDKQVGEYIEDEKKQQLVDIGLQFLLHTRYKVSGALKQKQPIRFEKNYRLGYLFNRLRRLKYEIAKFVFQAQAQDYYENKYTTMRLYERVLRYSIDIRDTIAYIKSIEDEPERKPQKSTRPFAIPNM